MTIDEVLFDKSYLTIYHKPEQKLIHLRWKGFASSTQFREGLTAALEFIKEHQVENWLGNLKMMELIVSQDEEWASTFFYPLLAATTLRKMAIVTSLDFLNNAAIRRIVQNTSGSTDFETRFFVDSAEANQWLIEAKQ